MTKKLTPARLRRLAIDAASMSHYRVGAVLSDGTRWLIGRAEKRSHPLARKFARSKNDDCIYIHAEIAAIVAAARYIMPPLSDRDFINDRVFKGFTLFVARIDKRGNVKLAKPCLGCQRAIVAFGITNVYWTENE